VDTAWVRIGRTVEPAAAGPALDAVCDTVVDGVVLFGKDGVVRRVNAHAVEHLGFDATGWNRADLERALEMRDENGRPLEPDHSPIVRAQHGDETRDLHVQIRRPDGVRRWIGVSATSMQEDGISGVALVTREITERVELTLLLRESERRLRTVLERITDGFVAIDVNGRVEYVNDVAERVLGRTRDSLLGRDAWSVLAGSPAVPFLDQWKRALREQVPVASEEYVPALDIWIEGRAFASPDGLTAYFSDVSDRRREQERLRRAQVLDEALSRINEAIDTELDFDSIMTTVVVEAARVLGAAGAGVVLGEGRGWVLRYLVGAQDVSALPVPVAKYELVDAMARADQPVVVGDLRTTAEGQEIAERYAINSLAAVRLGVRDEFLGALVFGFAEAPLEFGPERRAFLERLSGVVALGLENARRLSAERDVAETLQKALLPTTRCVEGIRLGTLYQAAKDSGRVGGDFYDVFETAGGRVALVIGDIAGKGLRAATATSFVKNTLRAYIEEGHAPSSAVAATNSVMFEESPPETFATLFLGLLDRATGELVYCSAGHPPPLLKRTNGGVLRLDVASPLVGAFPGGSFLEGHARLAEGDLLFLYTDGVTEARCASGMLGDEALFTFLESMPPTPPQDVPDAVFAFVMECTEGRLSDDVALLSVSIDPATHTRFD